MEYQYIVTDEKGNERKYKAISSIALTYGIHIFKSFEEFQHKLKDRCNVDLRNIDDVDKREQAIYKRLCGIKRPKPKAVKFKVGDKVECVGESSGGDGDKTYGGARWKLGFRFTVDNVTTYMNQDICWGSMGGGVYMHHLKLISRGRR